MPHSTSAVASPRFSGMRRRSTAMILPRVTGGQCGMRLQFSAGQEVATQREEEPRQTRGTDLRVNPALPLGNCTRVTYFAVRTIN